jgi:hypothetical protein
MIISLCEGHGKCDALCLNDDAMINCKPRRYLPNSVFVYILPLLSDILRQRCFRWELAMIFCSTAFIFSCVTEFSGKHADMLLLDMLGVLHKNV